MPCSPNDNQLNPPNLGAPPNIPGFGLPFGPPQIPFPDVLLPDGIPEDLLDLIDRLLTAIPGGPIVPNLPDKAKDIIDAIASLLDQLGPYLALYRFLQALLNIILCIIDVLCAAVNPFAMGRAMRRLFKRCLPDFLNLFPWLALIAMIIALILLLLALIRFLIEQILGIIEDIIRNIIELGRAAQFNDAERQLAGARKIAQLLCLIEQLIAILAALQVLFAIIEALAGIAGRTVCGKKGSTEGEDFECCPDEVCPPFILENPDGLTGSFGSLVYQNELNNDVSGFGFPIKLGPIRNERWQFFDTIDQQFNFADIITPIPASGPTTDGTEFSTFWPEGKEFEADSNLRKVPYILDLRVLVNPSSFGLTDPIGTERFFRIKNLVVTKKPTISFKQPDDSITPVDSGVIRIEGGLVFEDDGSTPFLIDGEQATLNNFIHLEQTIGANNTGDGYTFNNVEYTLRINHPALVGDQLITLGCEPTVQIESTITNDNNDIRSVIEKIGDVPNIGTTGDPVNGGGGSGALGCITDALANLRKNVSVENAETQRDEIVKCLNDLEDETLDFYDRAITAGADRFKSTVEIDPDVQFVESPIQVKVILKDIGGTTISFNVPEQARESVASKIGTDVTLGQVGQFTFDGYDAFIANLTSDKAGDGELTVSFDEQIFGELLNLDQDDVPTEVSETVISYRFIGRPEAADDAIPRRDESDVGRS